MSGTVFFLSDYGLDDEFVGVVHAVLCRQAEGTTVVDLTHQVPAYDVRAGSEALWRAAPHLGPGVVLAVVDPGVGSDRRALALEVGGGEPRYWVGPDNGLLLPGAETVGRLERAVALAPDPVVSTATTFDGRDLFAPAAAALAGGGALEALGPETDPGSLVRLPPHVATLATRSSGAGAGAGAGGSGGSPGEHLLRVSVAWNDHFGNVQLAVEPGQLPGAPERLAVRAPPDGVVAGEVHPVVRASSFWALSPGQLGAVRDANGRLTLVLQEASAAELLGVRPGDVVELTWS